MIIFRTSIERCDDVPAWKISVRALLDDFDYFCETPEVEQAFRERVRIERGEAAHVLQIASLEALLVKPFLIYEPDELRPAIRSLNGIGGVFDIDADVARNGRALEHWLSNPQTTNPMEDLGMEPIRDLVMTGRFLTDPFVDRGVMLAHMVPHLSALSSGTVLISHQEPPEDQMLPDQKMRQKERLQAAGATAQRLGVEIHCVHYGREQQGLPVRMRKNELGEIVPGASDLPLMVMSAHNEDFDCDDFCIPEEEVPSVIEFADWAEARLGIRPVPEEFSPFG
jgi:hypothetical protein